MIVNSMSFPMSMHVNVMQHATETQPHVQAVPQLTLQQADSSQLTQMQQAEFSQLTLQQADASQLTLQQAEPSQLTLPHTGDPSA